MIKVGITGQQGFIGWHLYHTLKLNEDLKLVDFQEAYFEQPENLQRFVKDCDAIVHLAALNRHNNPNDIYNTNIALVKQLISACEQTAAKPHILFASSTQEERDNPYGKSKREGRMLFEKWAINNNARFTGFIIPNVFGPFGKPYYNSVVATFCHQLTHNETPKIEIDAEIKLIYVGKLVEIISSQICTPKNNITGQVVIPHSKAIKVSGLLDILNGFMVNYNLKGIFPDFTDVFTHQLYITFLCYNDLKKLFPFKLKKHSDNRGNFIEVVKNYSGGQFSYSTTQPGITRGNHYHTRKAERFAVISGKAKISLRKIGEKEAIDYYLDGENPAFVDMPIWYTHNITNIGKTELITLFWINEHFNPNDTDTFYEEV